jgi:hypothetical protein
LAAAYVLGIVNALLQRADSALHLGGILVMSPDLVSGLTAAAGAYIVARMHITAAGPVPIVAAEEAAALLTNPGAPPAAAGTH